jgi:hypothetical protein
LRLVSKLRDALCLSAGPPCGYPETCAQSE